MPNDLDMLRQVPFFSAMDDDELSGVRAIMDKLEFQPGAVIIKEGELSDLFYVIVQGEVQYTVLDGEGEELVVDEEGPGGIIGELSSLTGEPRSARVSALDHVVAWVLEKDEFIDFLRTHPDAAIDILTVIGKRLHNMTSLLRRSASRNVNLEMEESYTVGQKVADRVAATMGSWPFIIFQSALLLTWITLNVTAWVNHWDPYPFILLNLALSFQAAYAAPFIMMSQNRAAAKDRLAAEIDHQINTKAELEVGLVLRRLEDLEERLARKSI